MKKVRQIINRSRGHKYPLILFSLLSLIPFYWLHGYPVGWGDTGLFAFFYNSSTLFNVYKYAWISQFLTGIPSGQSMLMLPFSGLFNLFTSFGLSSYIQQAFVYFLVLFVSMVFMYLFVYKLFGYRVDKKMIAAISAIFYAFNPLVMINYWVQGMLSIYLVPFIPVVLYFFLMGLKKQKFIYILLMSLVISFFSIAFLNPAFLIPMIIILSLFFIYRIVLCWKNKDKVKKMFIHTAVLVIFTFLINSWFILPFVTSVTEYYTIAITAMDPLSTLIGASRSTSLTTLFRLLPLKLNAGIWAYKNPVWRYYYNNPLFILLGIFVFFLILTPLILRGKDKNVLFFVLLLIAGLFLCLGINSPIGFIFKWMFTHIPYFYMFRSPYSKFVPFLLVSYSVLFGVGLASFYKWVKCRMELRYVKLMLAIIIFLTCGVYVFPLWSGSAVNTPIAIRGNKISSFIEVPSYYSNIARYFCKDPTDYRILSLPSRPSGYVGFDWEYGYDGPDYTHILYKHTTISSMTDADFYPSARVLSELKVQNLTGGLLYRITTLFGVKYIVIQNDVDITHGNYLGKKLTSQQELKLVLSQLGIPLIHSFGKLDLYKISDDYFLPHIYPSITLTLATGDIEALVPMTERKYLDNKPVLLFTEQNETFGLLLMADRNKAHSSSLIVHRGESFVFKDSMPEDLAIDATAYSSWLIADSKKQDKADGSWLIADRFEVKKAGVYEIWMENRNHQRNTNQYEYTNKKKWNIEVDGKEIAYSFWFLADSNKAQKYIKVGEVELEEGKHKIEVCSSLFVAHGKDKKIKLILVSKKEREKVEKEIWERINQPETEVAYIFSKDNGKFWVP